MLFVESKIAKVRRILLGATHPPLRILHVIYLCLFQARIKTGNEKSKSETVKNENETEKVTDPLEMLDSWRNKAEWYHNSARTIHRL